MNNNSLGVKVLATARGALAARLITTHIERVLARRARYAYLFLVLLSDGHFREVHKRAVLFLHDHALEQLKPHCSELCVRWLRQPRVQNLSI